jgi:hypothetical protein
VDIKVERWYAAIATRRSRRSFDGRPVPDDMLAAIDAMCREWRPYPDARAVLLRDTPPQIYTLTRADRRSTDPLTRIFTGITGAYGRVSGAPAALAFVGDTTSPTANAHVGYTGEALVLESTALGLDTCWVGGFFSRERTAALLDLADEDRVYAITPVGYAPEQHSGKEKIVFRSGGHKKRRALPQIAEGIAAKDWPGWAVSGVRAVRTAPSAINRQPWRFRLESNESVLLFHTIPDTTTVSPKLDCGIAMLHFELGVRHAGHRGAWEDIPDGGESEHEIARWRRDPTFGPLGQERRTREHPNEATQASR